MQTEHQVAGLDAVGVRVHCLALDVVELTSAAGKLTMHVINAVVEFERDLLIERTQARHPGRRLLACPEVQRQLPTRRPAIETAGRRCYLLNMTDTAFDTLAMTRQLKAKGFSSDQAEAITEAVRAGVTGGVATKADLAEIRNDLLWMKRIGGVIVVLLAVPILRDLLSALN